MLLFLLLLLFSIGTHPIFSALIKSTVVRTECLILTAAGSVMMIIGILGTIGSRLNRTCHLVSY